MPSSVYLLDTNVVLHLVRGGAVGKELAAAFGLLNSVNRPLVSIVTHGELLLLAARNTWGAEKRVALENALDNLVTVDLNDKAVLSAYVEVQLYSRHAPGGSRELNADLTTEILNAIMDAFAANSSLSKQALESDRVRSGLKEILLGPARLYEALREQSRPQG